MTNVGTSISIQQAVLQQIASIGSTVQSATMQSSFAVDSTGQTTSQKTVQSQLDQILSLLNTQGGNGYLFSGSWLNQPSVDTADHILNGNGAQAGLKQVIAERNQADRGADGLGRLVIPAAAGTTVAVREDAAASSRVSGSPATATALVYGRSANSVFWYTGEDGSGSARSTATARIDPTTTVSYGTRANEQGIRWIVQNIAALAAASYASSDPNASASYAALNSRVSVSYTH